MLETVEIFRDCSSVVRIRKQTKNLEASDLHVSLIKDGKKEVTEGDGGVDKAT